MIDGTAEAAPRPTKWLCAIGLMFATSAALADSGAAEGCAKGSEGEGFWQRLSDSYKQH